MSVRWGVAGPGPAADKVLRDLAHGQVPTAHGLSEIATKLGVRVIEGPAELP